MFSKRGEISTIVVLGTFAVIAVAALINSTVTNQRTSTNTQASVGNCRNNPENPPEGGYTWVANCSSTCAVNSDCPKNTGDPGNVNPETSNWCYGFQEGARCLQLQKGAGTNPTPVVGNQTSITSAPQNGPCDKPEGCGGGCNGNINSGCGYGGCRRWEQCANNTCFDTTNLGTQPAGPAACNDLATASSQQNLLPTITQTPVPQATLVPNNGSNTQPTATPTKGACRPGQTRCLDGVTCVEFQNECPSAPPIPTIKPQVNPNTKDVTPKPTNTPAVIPTVQNQNPLTPTPTPIRYTILEDIYVISCTQNGHYEWTSGCYFEGGTKGLNALFNK